MTAQVGNEIDEFVTNTLRNQLLGIPLDLPAINIARGRDTGMPSLNEARAQFSEMAGGDTQLDPYESWTDFALNLKNPASIVNFIAAYGTHDADRRRKTTLAGKRDGRMTSICAGRQSMLEWSETCRHSRRARSGPDPTRSAAMTTNPLVDDICYLDRYPGCRGLREPTQTLITPRTAGPRGVILNAFFSTASMLETYPDIAAAGINPLEH